MVLGAKIGARLETKVKDFRFESLFEHIFILSILSGIVYVFYCLPNASDKIINADALYVPTLLQDIKLNLMNFIGWNFPPASYFFPDAVLFSAIKLICDNIILQVFIYSVVQLWLLFLMSRWMFFELGGCSGWAFTLTFAVCAVALTTFGRLLAPEEFNRFYAYSLISGYHFGAYLSSLTCLTAAFCYIRTGSVMAFICIGLIATAACASDLLFLVYFSGPFLLTNMILLNTGILSRNRTLALSTVIVIAVAVATFLNGNINPTTAQYVEDPSFFLAASSMQRVLGEWLMRATAEHCFALIFIFLPLIIHLLQTAKAVSVMIAHGICPRRIVQDNKTDCVRHARWQYVRIFTLATVLSTVLAIAFIGSRIYLVSIEHYAAPLLYSPGLLALWSISITAKRWPFKVFQSYRRSTIVTVELSLVFLVASVDRQPVHQFLPVPPYVSCFRFMDTKAGLAGYWQAKPLILFSNHRLQIAAVTEDGAPREWIDNQFWYIDRFGNPMQPPQFEFIFMKWLEPAAVEKRYGPPDRIEGCDGSEIWFYDKPETLYLHLLQGHLKPFQTSLLRRGQALIPAGLLPGEIGNATGFGRVAVQDQDPAGFLISGSLTSLPPGQYRLEIEYSSSETREPNGKLTVALRSAGAETTGIVKTPLPLGDDTRAISIDVVNEKDPSLEVQVFYQGIGLLRVDHIIVRRLK